MWKENLYQPVEVLTRKHTKFPIDEHQHSFFEMVYVQSGSGSFYVKEGDFKVQQTNYKSHALFTVSPLTRTANTSSFVSPRIMQQTISANK